VSIFIIAIHNNLPQNIHANPCCYTIASFCQGFDSSLVTAFPSRPVPNVVMMDRRPAVAKAVKLHRPIFDEVGGHAELHS
jgi:hypothetical protein